MRKIVFITFLLVCTWFVRAQEKTISTVDATLGYWYGLYPETLYNLQWLKDTNAYVYATEQSFVITDAQTNKQTTISISDLKKTYPDIKKYPQIQYIDSHILVFRDDKSYQLYDYVAQKPFQFIEIDENAQNDVFNKQNNAVAYTIDNNLYIGTSQNAKIAVTNHQNSEIVSGQSIHRNEFGIKKGIFWSPNGNYLAFYEKNESNVTNYPLVDINTTPSSLKNIKYPMAGMPSEQAKVGIFNLKTQKVIYLDINTTDEHYLTNLSWSLDEKYILLAEINRAQNQYDLNRYDVVSGKKINTILTEKNDKWVEPENPAVFLPKSNNEFLWLSEKDGFMNVYLYNINGKLIKQLTNFQWVVQEIIGFDNKGENIFISGTGIDPREQKTFKIHLKSGKYENITPSEGTHNTQLSYNGNFLIDQFSNIQLPNRIEIIDLSKKNTRNTILNAVNPLRDYNIGTIELLKLKAEDNTDLYAKMIKPKHFDPTKKYPVLLYVYGGPHAQLVTNSWLASTELWMLAMASNENYIIFTLDNRGSANRGFAFESVIHRNLATYAIKDQLTAVDFLKKQKYIDPNRLSVYGWSFGGFLASSLMLRYPTFFTTAVAGGAVTDWKYYEVMYGERYMDTPQENPDGYQNTHVNNYIKNLKGKLLFIHGYLDDVVVPEHVLSVSQEAIKQGKLIDLFLYPNHKHNVSGQDRAHLTKLISEYIIEHNK
ncbi:S9 family peptidase [Capnocytophaga catalasegens]|uniref:Peptidase S9 n=1 Tax=Capnocytophaga catalasegens TaxID=1004260 RepID=A0AAV5AWE3_9FLAO|nr:S9 family peptidase [Capnocytophaga catalasegens]GIZ15796.1 peptidase S9 [Capnocytophaga catalasegens]GJM49808.1 peptidase S9 [Capnocytophaga catalasegens]GJM52973.1 peptidase S9 [Capnocytophaga catalasegens]